MYLLSFFFFSLPFTSALELIKDIFPGTSSSDPSQFVRLRPDVAFFVANDGVHGREPWLTDGTPEGTRLLIDLTTGAAGSVIGKAIYFDNKLYFWAGAQAAISVYVSDLTTEGTTGLFVQATPSGTIGGEFAIFRDDLYFYYASSLYRVLSGGFRLVQDFSTEASWQIDDRLWRLAVVNDEALLISALQSGLWAYLGEEDGLSQLSATETAAFRSLNLEVNGYIYFVSGNRALWRTDGSVGNTEQLTPDALDVRRVFDSVIDNRVFLSVDRFFIFSITFTGTELKPLGIPDPSQYYSETDFYVPGTENLLYESVPGYDEGTVFGFPGSLIILPSIRPGEISFAVNGVGAGISNSLQFWTTGGTEATTVLAQKLANLQPYEGEPTDDGRFLMRAGLPDQVWVTDGTTVGTRLLTELTSTGPLGGDTMVALGSTTLVFAGPISATASGTELIREDIPVRSTTTGTAVPTAGPTTVNSTATAAPTPVEISSASRCMVWWGIPMLVLAVVLVENVGQWQWQ